MFRRSFHTTARLLSRPNTKPSAPRKSSIPPAATKPKPTESPESLLDFMKAAYMPQSEYFILGFANPQLTGKQRLRSLAFFATGLTGTVLSDIYDVWGTGGALKSLPSSDDIVFIMTIKALEKRS